jgi:hypothetical protein
MQLVVALSLVAIGAIAAAAVLGAQAARSSPSSVAAPEPKFISISLTHNASRPPLKVIPSVPWFSGATGFQMMLLATTTSPKLNFTFTDYGAMGAFITNIDGIDGSGSSGYWSLFVNNVELQVGVSSAVVQAGDAMQWRFVS